MTASVRPAPDAVRTVAVIGTGVIGGGWAAHFLRTGYDVVAWDPVANADGLHGVVQVASVADAVAGADAAVLVDGRNMLDPASMREAGFTYDAIGRASG